MLVEAGAIVHEIAPVLDVLDEIHSPEVLGPEIRVLAVDRSLEAVDVHAGAAREVNVAQVHRGGLQIETGEPLGKLDRIEVEVLGRLQANRLAGLELGTGDPDVALAKYLETAAGRYLAGDQVDVVAGGQDQV